MRKPNSGGWRISFKVYDEFGDIVAKSGNIELLDGILSLENIIDKKVGYQIKKGFKNLFRIK